MKPRERLLLGLIVALGVGWTGYQGVKNLYFAELESLDKQIKAKKDAITKYNIEKAQMVSQRAIWEHRVMETLSLNPVDGRIRMLDELSALANRHRLGSNAVRPSTELFDKKTAITRLPFTVEGSGELTDIVRFMYDLHSLPFLARTEMVKIVPKGGKEKGKLQLTVKGETLVLPEQRLAPTTRTAELSPDKRQPIPRTEFDKPGEYLVIAERKPFDVYVAPPIPPVVHKPPEPVKVVTTQPGPAAPPGPPPPPPRDSNRNSTKIVGLIGTPTTQKVVVVGGDQRRREFEVGDLFDGGKVVYVHPEGAVAVYDNKPWLYVVGKNMSDAQILTEDVHPEIFTRLTGSPASTTQASAK